MALTDIATQLTPGRPTEVTFENVIGLPNLNQTVVLIGHQGATGSASGSNYQPIVIANSADPIAGPAEAAADFGAGSELALMVTAAILAVSDAGLPNFPNLVCIPLAPSDTASWGPVVNGTPSGLAALNKIEAEFVVSCYDAQTQQSLFSALVAQAKSISAAQSVQNNQFGTIAVGANQSVAAPATLFQYQSQYASPVWFRNTVNPQYTVAQLAAAQAGIYGSLSVPFNPLDNQVVGNLLNPTLASDQITVGGGKESEIALNLGWTPLRTLPNLSVAIVRSITAAVALPTEAYIDVQDYMVLYAFRKTIYANFNQPFWNQQKASQQSAQLILGEVIRLAQSFQDQGMFQAVAQLAPQFQVQRNASDRSRFDVLIPVNVIPGLHVIATNIQAGTQFDQITI